MVDVATVTKAMSDTVVRISHSVQHGERENDIVKVTQANCEALKALKELLPPGKTKAAVATAELAVACVDLLSALLAVKGLGATPEEQYKADGVNLSHLHKLHRAKRYLILKTKTGESQDIEKSLIGSARHLEKECTDLITPVASHAIADAKGVNIANVDALTKLVIVEGADVTGLMRLLEGVTDWPSFMAVYERDLKNVSVQGFKEKRRGLAAVAAKITEIGQTFGIPDVDWKEWEGVKASTCLTQVMLEAMQAYTKEGASPLEQRTATQAAMEPMKPLSLDKDSFGGIFRDRIIAGMKGKPWRQ